MQTVAYIELVDGDKDDHGDRAGKDHREISEHEQYGNNGKKHHRWRNEDKLPLDQRRDEIALNLMY